MAKKNIEFLGQNLTDQEILSYYQKCQALVFAGREDLGLVSLEAQACGKPVIAYKGGGIPETIVEGKTGDFFYPQTVGALTKTILKFDEKKYNSDTCRCQAQRFDLKVFKKKFKKLVMEKWKQYGKN